MHAALSYSYISRCYYYYHYQHRTFTENTRCGSPFREYVFKQERTLPLRDAPKHASYAPIWSVCSFAASRLLASCGEWKGTSQAHQWTTHCTKWNRNEHGTQHKSWYFRYLLFLFVHWIDGWGFDGAFERHTRASHIQIRFDDNKNLTHLVSIEQTRLGIAVESNQDADIYVVRAINKWSPEFDSANCKSTRTINDN